VERGKNSYFPFCPRSELPLKEAEWQANIQSQTAEFINSSFHRPQIIGIGLSGLGQKLYIPLGIAQLKLEGQLIDHLDSYLPGVLILDYYFHHVLIAIGKAISA
jgi:hypothetical protein